MNQDPAVVVDHPMGDAPVVELVAGDLAPAGVVDVLHPQPVVVLVAVARAVHHPPARGVLAGEVGRGGHIVHLLRHLASTSMRPKPGPREDPSVTFSTLL